MLSQAKATYALCLLNPPAPGPEVPARFLDYGAAHESVCAGRGHKNDFSQALVTEFIQWIRSLNQMGYRSEPLDWVRTP